MLLASNSLPGAIAVEACRCMILRRPAEKWNTALPPAHALWRRQSYVMPDAMRAEPECAHRS